MVPEDVIIANCQTAGYSTSAAREELAALVEAGELCEADGHYGRATEPGDEPLDIQTHRGNTSTPWQFSVKRMPDELVITQARGPPEKFDPVVKRFTIEEYPVGVEPPSSTMPSVGASGVRIPTAHRYGHIGVKVTLSNSCIGT